MGILKKVRFFKDMLLSMNDRLKAIESFGDGIINQEVAQKTLSELYRSRELPFNRISDAGFSVYSQHDEDGILLYIFSLAGTMNKKCVEICVGSGKESNTANLIVNHRWNGLLFDGNEQNIEKAKGFYSQCKSTKFWSPKIRREWITAENINTLLSDSNFAGEIDLLSLDIDGIDYWLWKSIEVINPRVVVLEFNHLLGPSASVTVPYDPEFKAMFSEYGTDYAGASLAAFVKLGKVKGYKLLGTNTISTNAFFIRKDIDHKFLPEVDPKDCFDHPRARFGMEVRYQNIKDKEWEQVD